MEWAIYRIKMQSEKWEARLIRTSGGQKETVLYGQWRSVCFVDLVNVYVISRR